MYGCCGGGGDEASARGDDGDNDCGDDLNAVVEHELSSWCLLVGFNSKLRISGRMETSRQMIVVARKFGRLLPRRCHQSS